MLWVIRLLVQRKIWSDHRGQDLIEYALLAALVTVSAVAVVPGVSSSINIVFSKVNSVMILAASS
jgi:pilus assembly protein Flp/PilA